MIDKRIPALLVFAAVSVGPVTLSAQTLEGTYRGMFVCEQIKGAPDILHVPLDLAVRGNNVQFARPRFNLLGTRVVGSELGFGTVDADGKLHVTSEWVFRGLNLSGDYSGTLTATGGALTGTQTWRGQEGIHGSRTCVAALVPAPKAGPVTSQQ
jgi:hypothetical protein